MIAHDTSNPSTWEAEGGGSCVLDKAGLNGKFFSAWAT